MEELSWMVEYAAFAIMLAMSVIIGLYYGCVEGKQNTISEYLLGGRHMSVFPITMSLIASHISGTTLLGVPSEIYTYGTQYLIIVIANVLVIVTVIYVYLPVFYELQLTSVYEYLERRFDSKIRTLVSIIFTISQIQYITFVIYLPGLAFNQAIGINMRLVTMILCAICIFYTTVGGLKAVVWTDAIQSIFTAFSIIIVIIMGLIQAGGFSNVIEANQKGDRIEFFKMDPDPYLRHTFWTVTIGMTFFWINYLGIYPGTVQRFVALSSYGKVRKALIYFIFGICVVKLFTGVIGLLIYAKYKDCDPVTANYIKSKKNLLPYYVMDVAGNIPGITGLFYSGMVSTALSTMSSTLNTMSGTIYEDFVVKAMGIQVSELTASVIMKCTVVVIGVICVSLVTLVDKLEGIVQLSISLGAITSGPILSVFTLGLVFPCSNSRGAIFGLLTSLGIMTWIITGAELAIFNNELKFTEKKISIAGCPANIIFKNQTDYSGLYRMNDDVHVSPNVWKIFTISYMHYCTIGTLVGIAVGLIISFLFPKNQNIDPKLLTPFVRKIKYHNNRTKAKGTSTAEEYISAAFQDTRL